MGCQYQTKSMNAAALNLYKCGHIQKVEACMCGQFFVMYLRAVCLSEMRKDRVHLFEMQLDSTNFEIKGSSCGFPAGCGRCKHVAALCYALDELQSLPDFQSVTKHLPTWNQPKAKKLNPLPVINLQTRKEELLPPTKNTRSQFDLVSQARKGLACETKFDPPPAKYRKIDRKNKTLR